MITLANNENLIQVTGSAVSLDCVLELTDGRVVNLNHDDASTKVLASGPASVARIMIVNTTGSPQTLTFYKQVKGNRNFRLAPTLTLAAGEGFRWEPGTGLQLFDATGRVRVNNS
jgi:hypothetical protein